ncbi:MAG: trimethylamine methyltransferase, partial [Gammaproteobacteria bacterium]|nr:trimethylamine methyltransferase [Gammaproteobacteria bacterium]
MGRSTNRRTGGRANRIAARRSAASVETAAYISRQIPYSCVLNDEALELIEHNADTVLEEIGIEFRDTPDALALWRDAGADVDGERVRFPRGLCRSLIQATAPAEFTQHARNPARTTIIGGDRTVLAPAYGSPFVRDLDQGRRYATIEDFKNFVKLTYMSPSLHHSGGTVCEPVDLPVNKRHFDMIYSHIKYSDKPFMGSVTHAERAQDTVEMARIVFGEDFIDQNTVVTSLINANSPMTFDATMLGAAKVYAENNQATVISPFILAGAMSPVTVAGTLIQILAEAMAGMAYTQLVRPGAPVVFGTFASSI